MSERTKRLTVVLLAIAIAVVIFAWFSGYFVGEAIADSENAADSRSMQ